MKNRDFFTIQYIGRAHKDKNKTNKTESEGNPIGIFQVKDRSGSE